MPRYFTLEQAEQTLPRVESAVRESLVLKEQYQIAEQVFRDLTRKVMLSGGMMVDRDRAGRLKQERDHCAVRLQSALNTIQESGCLVKDLDIGLLDFPTIYHGREVYLCWRLGESRIEYWHDIDAGFRGRRRIDAEFVQNHRGESEL